MEGFPDSPWAKITTDEDGNPVSWHPLLSHASDVGAVFEHLLRETVYRNRFSSLLDWSDLKESHIQRLAVLGAYHDAGKCNRGFQNRKNPSPDLFAGHESEMISALAPESDDDLLVALGIRELYDWFECSINDDPIIDILCATWAHHGRPRSIRGASYDKRLWEDGEEYRPKKALEELYDYVKCWYPEAFRKNPRPFPDTPSFRHAFSGLVTLADWIGSNTKFFEYAEKPEGRIHEARKKAKDVLQKMRLDPSQIRSMLSEPIHFSGFTDFDNPHDIQEACLDLSTDKDGSIVILESDTGSGKTEAAIARFLELFEARQVDGLYFALPTRAAAKQLHDRVRSAMDQMFGGGGLPTVLAVPGYIRVDGLDGDPNALPGYEVQWPDDPNVHYRGWAAEDSKRYLAAPIAVGTVDQVLLSSLEVSHSHLRATSLLRHLLVVDEVHSSDPYMDSILNRVLTFHREAGGHAMLMSATLGATERESFVSSGENSSGPDLDQAQNSPYPLITYMDNSRENPEYTHAKSTGIEKSLNLDLKESASRPDHVAETALRHARKGARVLVIRNLVKSCLETQRALEMKTDKESILFGSPGRPAPHHSRFARLDRQHLDDRIESEFGKGSNTEGVVAIATQTVEQSLDIDADIIITDLCPADVLLQRFGRLHRHPNRSRPSGYEESRGVILTPEHRDLTRAITSAGDQSGSGLQGKHGLGTVYPDLRNIEATWRLLESSETWRIPEDNRMIVEKTTHPEKLAKITEEKGDKWKLHEEYIQGTKLARRSHGRFISVDRTNPFMNSSAPEDIEQIRTRLGNDRWTVEFDESISSPFGQTISFLHLPGHWFGDLPEDHDAFTPEKVTVGNCGLEFSIKGHKIYYNRHGLSHRGYDE